MAANESLIERLRKTYINVRFYVDPIGKISWIGGFVPSPMHEAEIDNHNSSYTPEYSKAMYSAMRFSRKYVTHWYVREVSPGVYEAWAHSSDDEKTVACFYCGAFQWP